MLWPKLRFWQRIAEVGFLAEIAFAMFFMCISALAFESVRLVDAKIGIIVASVISGVLGSWILITSGAKKPEK